MTDIKLTLRKDPSRRAPNIEAEAKWIAECGPIYYSLQVRPARVDEGCWVYFIRDGNLVARARADQFRPRNGVEDRSTFTGAEAPSNAGVWEVACSNMELPARPMPHRGFQRFRYVTDEATTSYADAALTRWRQSSRAQRNP